MSTRFAARTTIEERQPLRQAARIAVVMLLVLSVGVVVPSLSPPPASAAVVVTNPGHHWVLVNKARPLNPRTYSPPGLVAATGSGHLLRPMPARQLRRLFNGAAAAGHRLVLVSGYRSYHQQARLYNYYVNLYGRAYANRISARPGYSEHQTGLTADVGLPGGQCALSTCFGSTPAGRWVAAQAHRYGFIIRYPRGYERVTGYAYEPWHLRFVGPSLAARMRTAKLPTLEHVFPESQQRRARLAAPPAVS